MVCDLANQLGLIPAHAGSTGAVERGYPHVQAHPRSRGEHEKTNELGPMTVGSSPLTRGAHE